MSKRFSIFFSTGLISLVLLLGAVPALAADDEVDNPNLRGNVFGQLEAGVETEPGTAERPADPRLIAAYVMRIALSLLAIIFTFLLMLSGYWFLTARGEEEKITKAKNTAKQAVTGLIITLAAYALVTYFVTALRGAVQEGNPSVFFED